MFLHTIASLSVDRGGTSRCVSELCGGIASTGADVGILTTADSSAAPGKFLPPGKSCAVVESDDKGVLGRFGLPFYAKLNDRLRSQQVELIHDHGVWLVTNYMAARLAYKYGVPLAISTHGMVEPWSLAQSATKKKIAFSIYQRGVFKRASVFFATSEAEAFNIRQLGLKQPIAVIPNGVAIPESISLSKETRQNSERIILFLSRVHKKKGLINLARAWANIREPGWRLVIAGNDESGHKEEVLSVIRGLGIGQWFDFIGPVHGKDKEDIYLNADVFILPTFSENFGVVIAEALSYGVPVITTTGTPWKSLVKSNSGWWVKPDVEHITAAIREAISMTDGERSDMGLNGRKHVIDNYSWTSVVSGTLSVYSWLLGQSERPDCVIS